MDIAGLLAEAITKHSNAMPLPNTPGAPSFHGIDVTTFLHKYESLAAFTATDVTESSVIAMFPFYCAECSDVQEMVMMMRGYADRDWTALKKELLDTFRHADSRALIYTRQHLEQLCATFRDGHRGRDHADFGGLDQTESLKSFLRTYDHISRVVTERGMMCEYERTEMLLRALPKRLWRKAVTKLGMHPLEPSTFDYGKLHSWVTAKITAAEALAMFECLALTSPAATEMTPTTSPALPSSAPAPSPAPTAAVPLMTSGTPTTSPAPMTPTTLTAPTASVTPMAPTISTTAHKSPAATDITSTSSGTASPMTLTVPTAPTVQPTAPMTSENMTTLMSPTTPTAPSTILTTPTASIAPMAPPTVVTSPALTASTASTPPARTHTARQGTIHAGPMVRLGIIRVEPPQGQKIRRHHYAHPQPIRPHRTESTVTCRSEPAPPNRQEPVKLPRSKPIVPSHNQPVPPYRQEAVQPPPCQEPVQPPQQVDHPPCYYCADDQHNLRKCTDLRTDLGKGIVSINNRDRLVLGTAGGEIPLEPAHRDYRTIKDYARAGAPILSAPSPAPAPSPVSQPAPLQTPPPARLSRLPAPLLSPEQLTQLIQEVSEHFARSRQYGVDVSPPPPPSAPSPQKARP
ncbi:hypothetical protein K440DRAFT_638263 [Wilcoxina mikolae CBS 423.85]|nr:hypothetical protein K440DRAFT_638263 [Wilcoxina mikolae CBS 423.85]